MTVPKRFGMLRFISGLLKVLAWIELVLAVIFGIFVALSSMMNIGQVLGTEPNQLPILGGLLDFFFSVGGGLIAGIVAALAGVLYFFFLYGLGELIALYLATEENTRLTAALLLRMHQESQPEPRANAAYASTYASEPFES
jgi:hypothetical protein